MPETFPVITDTGQLQDQECLTVAELASTLHTTKDAVYRKTASGEWPYFKVVRRVYFTPDNVRTILALSTHGPTAPAAPAPDSSSDGNVRRMRGRGA
jgi:hypothetical protein